MSCKGLSDIKSLIGQISDQLRVKEVALWDKGNLLTAIKRGGELQIDGVIFNALENLFQDG